MRSEEKMLKRIVSGSVLGLAVALSGAAAAQEYPVKAIRFIAPNLPGGPTDILARLLGGKLAEAFGQPVVVENRSGAGGNIGTEVAAKAPADGYTLVTGNNATFGANVSLYKSLGFDPIKDFTPVILVGTQPNILVVHPSVPAKSVRELIALAKARPGQLNYAGSGQGAAAHLAAELFKSMAKVDILHVPYKSAGPALVDLIAGHNQMMFATALSVQSFIKSDRLRALAVTTAKRSRLFPELPTIAEAGVPGFEATTWHGVLVAAGTPTPIVTKLNTELNRALQMPDVRERLTGLGAEIIGGTPREFADHIKAEIPKWAKVIRDANVKLD
jgi:tripartite-type tricarboxylate transporter receptor subunit TctC